MQQQQQQCRSNGAAMPLHCSSKAAAGMQQGSSKAAAALQQDGSNTAVSISVAAIQQYVRAMQQAAAR